MERGWQRVLRLQLPVPEVPPLLRMGVTELVDGRCYPTARVGHIRCIDHAVSRAVDAQGHRVAAGVSDRRNVPMRAAHRLSASPRSDLDLGPLDSYSMRLGWARGAWSAQASGASLTMPEAITPYDAKKLSASVSYEARERAPDRRAVAWTAAFGQNREIHGNLEAYLLEGRMQLASRDAVYAPSPSPKAFSMPGSTLLAPCIVIASRRLVRSRWATCTISGRRRPPEWGSAAT
jgi:hypothetical protein